MKTYKTILVDTLFVAGVLGTIYGLFRVVQSAILICTATQLHKEDLHLLLMMCVFLTGFCLSIVAISLLLAELFRSYERVHEYKLRNGVQKELLIKLHEDRKKRLYNYEEAKVVVEDVPMDYEEVFTNGI